MPPKARAIGDLEKPRRNDLVGVHVRYGQRCGDRGLRREALHHINSRTSVSRPVTAAAAAIGGESKWVRPPAPWRPSKLRFEVEAQRWRGSSLSLLIATHIEQPGSRHSKPASVK